LTEELQIRVFGDPTLPTLVYLPGSHGDWTLIAGFRGVLSGRVRFVEITYPRTLTWTIEDYATEIEKALVARGIEHGWLVGESFGSQPAWGLVERSASNGRFRIEGLILAAGFVKHPISWGPIFLRRIGQWRPQSLFRLTMSVYAWCHRLLHRLTPEARKDLDEFMARRTPLDRRAMSHRLDLISGYDPRPIARSCRVPVFYLAGAFDPLVPWPYVRRWLRGNCPGYRGGRTILFADHNVLASAPRTSAGQVLQWIAQGGAS
jgi:pimeloyl-ACP methyl ester carboxylesterase